MKVDRVADMKVDLVVGKVANMKVDNVADMKVDMVADRGVDKVARSSWKTKSSIPDRPQGPGSGSGGPGGSGETAAGRKVGAQRAPKLLVCYNWGKSNPCPSPNNQNLQICVFTNWFFQSKPIQYCPHTIIALLFLSEIVRIQHFCPFWTNTLD